MAGKKKNNQKQTESVIVALVILFVTLLMMIAGVVIYRANRPHRSNRSSGGGGTVTSSSTVSPKPSEMPKPTETPKPSQTAQPESPKPAETPEMSSDKLAKKNAFLETAADIEWYSEQNLDMAGTQAEINRESGIVFEKWDVLLNEVYRYLQTIMSDSDFQQLQNEELIWISEKETAIEEAGAEWGGGSGEPMVRNLTAIQYTKERCYYLISLID